MEENSSRWTARRPTGFQSPCHPRIVSRYKIYKKTKTIYTYRYIYVYSSCCVLFPSVVTCSYVRKLSYMQIGRVYVRLVGWQNSFIISDKFAVKRQIANKKNTIVLWGCTRCEGGGNRIRNTDMCTYISCIFEFVMKNCRLCCNDESMTFFYFLFFKFPLPIPQVTDGIFLSMIRYGFTMRIPPHYRETV